MKTHFRQTIFMSALFVPCAAYADDWTGFGLLMMGGCTLIFALPLFLVLAFFRRLHRVVYRLAWAVFALTMLLWVLMAPDAISFIRKEIWHERGAGLLLNPFLWSFPATIALFGVIQWRHRRAQRNVGAGQTAA